MCWKLLVNMRATEIHPDIAAVFGSAVAALTFALFQPMLFHRYFWLPFGIIQCLWAMRRAELRNRVSPTGGAAAVGRGSSAPVPALASGSPRTDVRP